MKTRTKKIFFLAFIIVCYGINVSAQLSGYDIMVKVDQIPDGDSRKTLMKMELINKRGSKRTRTMLSYSKDYGKDSKAIMFFEEPADVKGTGFLTWDYNDESKDDDRWLYLPAMKKTRRISGSSAKKDYFMGSDFTYDDMGNRSVDADNYKLLREETLNGFKCWVIENTPKDEEGMYSKTISRVRQDNFIIVKVEFYDKMGILLKDLIVDKVNKIDGFWTATKMHMKNNQRNHQTVITIESIQYNIPLDDNSFTVNSLGKGIIQ